MNLASPGRRWSVSRWWRCGKQFTYQHRDYCERLVLISSGGLGPDLSWILRILSAPGVELVLPVVAPRPVLTSATSWGRGSRRPESTRRDAGEIWNAYSSLSDGQTRQAFLRTLRSVVDYRGQAVSAINKLHLSSGLPILLIWGDQDRIIPVAHGYATHAALPGSRLEVLPGVGHFPHVESPTAVVEILDDFIATTGQCRCDESKIVISTVVQPASTSRFSLRRVSRSSEAA